MRSEFALRRWDVAGDDEISLQLLSQPELTHHAIDVLGPRTHLVEPRTPGSDSGASATWRLPQAVVIL